MVCSVPQQQLAARSTTSSTSCAGGIAVAAMEGAVRVLLAGVGEDVAREGLADTPQVRGRAALACELLLGAIAAASRAAPLAEGGQGDAGDDRGLQAGARGVSGPHWLAAATWCARRRPAAHAARLRPAPRPAGC